MNKNMNWSGCGAIAALLVVALLLYEGFDWTVNRIYVPEGKSLLAALQGPVDLHLGQQVCRARPFCRGGRNRRERRRCPAPAGISIARSGGSGPWSTTWWCNPANWRSSPASWATICPAANSWWMAISARPRARASCGGPLAPAAIASIPTATKSASSRPSRSTRATGKSSIPAGSTSTPATSAW